MKLQALNDALRLTKAGRLTEATALLRGGLFDEAGRPQERPRSRAPELLALGRERPTKARPQRPSPAPRASAPTSAAAGRFTWHSVSNGSGSRRYKLYVPESAGQTARPLVLMLHGCTQTADDFAAGTRMNAVADEHGLLVAYPEQGAAHNTMRCWNWFKPGDQARGSGEMALIAAVVADAARHHPVDAARVFVAGLSAGGAAAANLARAYPDVFRGCGVHSGLACGAARDLPSALDAMKRGAPGRAASARDVPCIVFHGSADGTVHPANARHVLAGAVADLPAPATTHGRAAGGAAYTREVWADGRGRPLAEAWTVEGAGHAWSGGSPAGTYTDPRGPDASREFVRFFLGLG